MTTPANQPGKFFYPGKTGRPEEDHDQPEYVPLGRVPASQAAQLCEKLELEGVPCHFAPVEANPTEGELVHEPQAEILVEASQLEHAREVFADPAPTVEEEDEDTFELSDDGYADAWVCRHCRTHSLHVLPLPPGWPNVRNAGVFLAAFPAFVLAFDWVLEKGAGVTTPQFPDWLQITWLLTVIAMFTSLIFARRGKRCEKCGWEYWPKKGSAQ